MNIDDEPLVTFAILTFNQQDYIEKAISGAICQNYKNIEFVLSDDCSEDNTFEIMQNFVNSYDGNAKFILNKTPYNKCTLSHFFDVVDLSSGRIIVLSAGDDFSYPNRVSEIVKRWKIENPVGLYSNYNLIDSTGVLIQNDYSPIKNNDHLDTIFFKPSFFEMHGASSAYDMEFIRTLPRPTGRFFFEDSYMTFMIKLHSQQISKINLPLVGYRTHDHSVSNSYCETNSLKQFFNNELKSEFYALNKFHLFCFFEKYISTLDPSKINPLFNKSNFSFYVLTLYIKGSWSKISFFKRLSYIFKMKDNRPFLEWSILRVFGYYTFSCFKYIHATFIS